MELYIYILKLFFAYILLFFGCILFFTFEWESWAWWDWPLTRSTSHHPSVLWHSWLGCMTCKIVSEITYNVLSGTLNPTIPIFIIVSVRVGRFKSWFKSHDFFLKKVIQFKSQLPVYFESSLWKNIWHIWHMRNTYTLWNCIHSLHM